MVIDRFVARHLKVVTAMYHSFSLCAMNRIDWSKIDLPPCDWGYDSIWNQAWAAACPLL